MRYGKGHKEETRRRIIDTAARRFRRDGIEAVGLAPLMKDLGLTHGGFYAHFSSKEALIAEALRAGFCETNERFADAMAQPGEEGGLGALIGLYLSDLHRDLPDHGCTAAALASELGRLSVSTRQAFGEGLDDMIGIIEAQLAQQGDPAPHRKAQALLTAMVGAIVLARATKGADASAEFLDAGRMAVAAILDSNATDASPTDRAGNA